MEIIRYGSPNQSTIIRTEPMFVKNRFLEGLLMAGSRQYGRQFARRIPDIERGPTKPSVLNLDGRLDWPIVAGSPIPLH